MNRPAGRSGHADRLKHKPHLLNYYNDLLAYLAGRASLDERTLDAAFKLAVASEYHFLPIEVVIARALARGELCEFADVVFELARAGFPFAKTFLAAYRKIDYPIKADAPLLVSLVRDSLCRIPKSEKVIELVYSSGDGDAARFLLHATASIASAAPGALAELLPRVVSAMRSLPRPLFSTWLRRGCDLLESLRAEEGVAFLKMESVASRRLLGLNHAALADVRRVLGIYASSLAGRTLAVVERETSVFGPGAPFTDGRSVFLPPSVDFFADPVHNERAYSALTAVQAATVAYGTYGFDLQKISFRAELADRYGTQLPDVMENARREYRGRAEEVRERRTGEVEAVFKGLRAIRLLETQLEKFFYSFPTPDLAKTIFTLVETGRIERRLSGTYGGLREDLASLNAKLWERRPEAAVAEDNSFAKFEAALEGLIQWSLQGRYKAGELDEGTAAALKRITSAYDEVQNENATVEDAALVAFNIYNVFFELYPLVSLTRRLDVRARTAGLGKIELAPEIVADSSPDLVTAVDNRFTHENLSHDEEDAVDLAAAGARADTAADLKREIASGRVRVYRYDEFDCLKSVMLPGHCTLYERTLPPGDPGYFDSVLARHAAVYKRLRKKILALKPEEVELSRKWLSGDEVHLQDAVDFAIDLARGRTPEEKIYVKKIRNRRDVAAAVLLDASSSTEETVGGRRIIDIEKDALCLLARTLEAVGDDFALYTFAGSGRHGVFFNVVKEWHEPWNAPVRARVGAVEAVASNRDGCAVRHATAKLAALPHKTRLLLLLSDGIPADVDYGSASNVETSRYAIEDTRRAIREAKKAGITPYCLTIDRAARDYIARLYGQYHFQVLSDIATLPEKLSKLYLRLTR